ncbi:MAG: UDP-N-acetylmuramate dehydrogenase [Candidatus Uhrbacteria bacterium]
MNEKLKTIFQDRFKENEPLAKHTTWRIGGPAKWFVEARNSDEVKTAVSLATEAGINWFVLGGGSNVLVNDDGFAGLVIQLALRDIRVEGNKITVSVGVPAVLLARTAAEAGLSGLEWMATLPGTVGGAVRGNAGCFGSETKDRLVSATILRDGAIVEVLKNDLSFDYRHSIFKKNKEIILAAVFELLPGDPEIIKSKMAEFLAKRLATQPPAGGTTGCVFKNYKIKDNELDRLKQEIDIVGANGCSPINNGIIPAGWLIEQMDLKGKKIGGAKVSEKHANFIENVDGATASDVVQLIALIKMNARDRFGIQLEEEVEYLGF